MDNSPWFNQAATEMNGQNNDNNNAGNSRVDLTLKLGLPLFDSLQNPALYHNIQQGPVNEGAMAEAPQQHFNGSQYAAWLSPDQIGNSSSAHNMNYPNVFNNFSGPSVEFPPYDTINSYNYVPPPPPPPLHELPPNSYTLLDVPPRRAAQLQQREFESSSGWGLGRGQRGYGLYNDPNKRCTNYNCNTNDTPMWRKGPLGPKTLCNACGIKYRKEEEKRKTKEGRDGEQQFDLNE
ncbi:hypothetical protein ERO13_A05G066700v2 [Gossypium hirsutum]|uniref:GATA-type domain-containing protein n=5 Tax=Gossypium TaxID=3633 RepID=A0ABR0PTK3_GOSAR|nr:GATA transcription factor 29-like [Gossypium hirsutum]KAK5830336.1 hypothetical protein PVK06_014130 [Gossypium arboreum]TYI25786.1 hypothetical protein ES332_A05G072200v1 [Gossypium tomentosum]TYJ32961.1 hypothetical protein E1A91_A05G070000v1 [Gossypium mustelinum]KAG4198111.1 hypothetical protein ERO13_A05G066700v2 [Gossypium hirsutum]TYI25787.1 hypothetical protein ES332_A05G072200v1 [Gossypium tomentosum]